MKFINILFKTGVVLYILAIVFKVMHWPFASALLVFSPLIMAVAGVFSFIGVSTIGRAVPIRRVLISTLAVVGMFHLMLWPSFYLFDLLIALTPIVYIVLRIKKNTFDQKDMRLGLVALLTLFAMHIPTYKYFELYADRWLHQPLTEEYPEVTAEVKLEYAFYLNQAGQKEACLDTLKRIQSYFPNETREYVFNELKISENFHQLSTEYIEAVENGTPFIYVKPYYRYR